MWTSTRELFVSSDLNGKENVYRRGKELVGEATFLLKKRLTASWKTKDLSILLFLFFLLPSCVCPAINIVIRVVFTSSL